MKLIDRLHAASRRLPHDKSGNVLMIMAAAIVPLLGMIGSGVDISRAYMAQLRLQQACDAGALAGRRAMAAKQWSDAANTEAHRMFNFNYPANLYGSQNVVFEATSSTAADVEAQARAFLPTIIMHMWPFGKQGFDLVADCTAKLEISNTDVMLVLDITGSMSSNATGGSKTRIQALEEAALVFFDTITSATKIGDGRLRIGIVPYSSNVNVGQILVAKNKDWISDYVVMPSRTPTYRIKLQRRTSSTGSWGDVEPTNTESVGSWTTIAIASGVTTSNSCTSRVIPAESYAQLGEPNANIARRTITPYTTGSGTTYSHKNYNAPATATASSTQKYFRYKYVWNDSACELQQAVVTRNITQRVRIDGTSFHDEYRYQDRVFNVSAVKDGNSISADLNTSSTVPTFSWGGCVTERRTTPFGKSERAPSSALDMDIDLKPTDVRSRWSVFMPQLGYFRTRNYSSQPSNLDARNVSTDDISSSEYANFAGYLSSGIAVCPDAATKLTTMAASDRATFANKVKFTPVGGTYHDIGMAWGLRLLSPDGLFKDENEDAAAPNKRPIGRHLIFMTDGAMAPNAFNITSQGYEHFDQRVTGSINASELKDRHDNRFVQLCEAGRSKNITIWVIAFDTNADATMLQCATAGKMYTPITASDLSAVFRDIAGQISRLRLSQ